HTKLLFEDFTTHNFTRTYEQRSNHTPFVWLFHIRSTHRCLLIVDTVVLRKSCWQNFQSEN
ncbi:MAG: hypothetical protein O4803_10785, partial [Trichodesmium sp. St15_bin1_1]|nr:hypothetical protein [Trichodesmium sp. St15_bin1_1]